MTATVHRWCTVVVAASVAVVLGGCADEGTPARGALVVSAAASLAPAFTAIEEEFTAANPGIEVAVNFGSSTQLASQIEQGAPADVVAFADTTPMDSLGDAGLLAGPPTIFARNRLAVVTAPGNPSRISGVADLAGVGTVSLCVRTAPCGGFAEQVLRNEAVTIPEDRITRGTDAASTLSAVSQGDADAGIVYATDAASAGHLVGTIPIPATSNIVADYPIAALRSSDDRASAERFVAFVLGEVGRAELLDAGFLAP